MILNGPISDFRKRRFDRKCMRAELGIKTPVAVKIAVAVLVACAAVFLCLGAEVVREASLARSLEPIGEKTGDDSNRIDNPDYAGWLTVEGTSISTPVASCRKGDPDGFYLSHGIDRAPSFSGCPFIAEGSSVSSTNMLVYGHNMGFGTLAFTELQSSYRQDRFSEIGNVTFKGKDGKELKFKPVLGLRVPRNFDTLLRFDFAGRVDYATWLDRLEERATAKADMDGSPESVLTLVTCSSAIGGERYRSVLVCERIG